ncbi:MAG: SusD/RagB family nutrient-binding outer membrane lipoprotein [Parabacteroides sp.]|uniref:SusD/RagB family nutrient-binding outer membrane lipoprotein n=1 Tax=Parabacteroides faecalis TaxID=2924040 RepID=A0ABT0C3I5_9BACT|nr:SusD/RagB family nutrient-binding outer membrane lipoprotein [Parabacteroides faecalis]MCI7286330.1 SusD/RagB family nutrient-binding outer membrane lipoprotein [Parabacteroides sp.]MCJ2381579.1 SusD/RagB family nutrient-binding outer membrane lipoprotein [Parabacteroides faecalis]MDD7560483.1 SusD/RagB family nutrient-binding outer membrane lipoprotein [Parabacteroides sp.]MDY6255695.1 SusD/RagB family nutrient-binding outer membrane lipoprotein [Bacteroidales bacterium]
MKNISIMASLLLAGSSLLMTGCQDDFAEVNVDPSSVTKGNVGYLFSQGVLEFEPSDYTYWFYNANQIYNWMQIMVPIESVTSTIFEGGTSTSSSIRVLKYLNEIKYVRSEMTPEESAAYAQYEAAMNVLCVYMGIFDSDFIGDIPYTEAAQVLHGGTLTPKYDRIADLYDLWLTQLDENINTFMTAEKQEFDPVQDPVFGGQAAKWAKLANSLKLKIAARLISQDRARALQIAEEVANASCGYINSEADDFLFNKATNNTSNNDYVYHWSNGILQSSAGSQSIIDLMVNNLDPRVRFIFQKNDWNSKVVQLFFDAKRQGDVPSYIMDKINYTVGSDGTYKFESWKAPGEPWVRYHGLPLAFNAGQQAGTYGDWFNYDINCKYDDNYTYKPFSMFQTEQVYGRIDFTLPVASGDAVIQDVDDMPWFGMYLTTAEVNLYLAEFKLLGANLPQTASEYFNTALRASVEEYDRLASLNRIPYYGTTYNYDPNEKVIDLQAGEIETMMSHEAYQLTGNNTEDLEKVYIQQTLHFLMSPIDAWVTCRRAGIPKIGSTIWDREDYSANGLPVTEIPRRTVLSAPSPTDLMYDILMNAYETQGFSIGSADGVLNSERVWQDQGAPQYGEGPSL